MVQPEIQDYVTIWLEKERFFYLIIHKKFQTFHFKWKFISVKYIGLIEGNFGMFNKNENFRKKL